MGLWCQCFEVRGKVWKEVLVFRDLRAVQIFKIDSYGHQHYRPLASTRGFSTTAFVLLRGAGPLSTPPMPGTASPKNSPAPTTEMSPGQRLALNMDRCIGAL